MPRRKPRPRDLFARNGYARVPDLERREKDGRRYKKGWEVRLVASDEGEAQEIAAIARGLEYSPGRVFRKHQQYVVPIYGEAAVEEFSRTRAEIARGADEPVIRAEIHDLLD